MTNTAPKLRVGPLRRMHAALERRLPERRLFLRTDTETRYIRLSSETQIVAAVASSIFVGWTIFASAILIMDSLGADSARQQVARSQSDFERRLNTMSAERDARAQEAEAARARFNTALNEVSAMQTKLLATETRLRELETGIDAMQTTLQTTLSERDKARLDYTALMAEINAPETQTEADALDDMVTTLDDMIVALDELAVERDRIAAVAQTSDDIVAELELEARLNAQKNDSIFKQLEEAVSVSMEPLDEMFKATGLPTDRIIDQVRRGYNGQGGPLEPISFSTKGGLPDPDSLRANAVLKNLEQMNIYRMAVEKLPFGHPVKDNHRYSSGFGWRSDPKNGSRRLHKGSDFAGRPGTDIFATADGVVTHAGWSSGYGKLIKIQHEFGIETRYAHLTAINVSVGQKVSRDMKIGDMGSTGRSTGTHLHYEVRVGGTPVNPMTYIKAAQNVF